MNTESTQTPESLGSPHGCAGSEFSVEDARWDNYDDEGCYRCGGSGTIVTCIDDICRNTGECFHGDGEVPCPNCSDYR